MASAASSRTRASVPGFPGPGRTGCVTPWPVTCWPPDPGCRRSGRCCGTAVSCPRRSTPRSTAAGSASWPGPGREVRDERPAPGRQRLPGDAPGPGVQPGARGPVADELRRLPRAGRLGLHYHRARRHLAARTRAGVNPAHWNRRLAVVRVFARHLSTLDPATQIPPAELMPCRYRRVAPYLFTPEQIDALIQAAAGL